MIWLRWFEMCWMNLHPWWNLISKKRVICLFMLPVFFVAWFSSDDFLKNVFSLDLILLLFIFSVHCSLIKSWYHFDKISSLLVVFSAYLARPRPIIYQSIISALFSSTRFSLESSRTIKKSSPVRFSIRSTEVRYLFRSFFHYNIMRFWEIWFCLFSI